MFQARHDSEHRASWIMAMPTILLLLLFSLYPFFYVLFLSFSDSSLAQPFEEFIGWQHYINGLEDEILRQSISNTLIFAFVVTILETIIGFVLALFFYRSMRSGRYLRTLALLPFIAPPVAVAMIWRLIYNPSAGLLNHYMGQFGWTTEPIAFLGQQSTAMLSIMVIDVWQWTPFVFILALAALQALPTDPYEAAAVDGASPLQSFFYITLPLISPSLMVIAIIRMIGAFKVFDLVYMLTGGGPGQATQVASFYIHRVAFRRFDLGYASSLTIYLLIILIVVITLLTFVQGWLRKRFE
jgi:multiple sugar transport system permease protein